MPHQTQAEMFIKTLGDLLCTEREIRQAGLLRQNKAHAERYLQACAPELAAIHRRAEWTPARNETGQQV